MPDSIYTQADVDQIVAGLQAVDTAHATQIAALATAVAALQASNPPPLPPPPPPPPPPPVTTGQFQVKGTQILTPDGKVLLPLGFNMGAPQSFDWKGIAKGHSADVIAWGANIIRLNLMVTSTQGWSRWASSGYQALLGDVDDIMNEYGAKGIIVMVEGHDSTSNAGQAQQFWTDVVKKYAANPYLWVNYQNEYGWSDSADWLKVHKGWLKIVRDAGYKGPYVADCLNTGNDAGWANAPRIYEAGGKDLLAADPLKNVVFSHHNYGGVDDNIGSATYYANVKAAGLPMLVGEFGQTIDGTSGAGTYQQNVNGVNSVCSLARSTGVGGIAWHGTHGDNYSMKANGNALWDGGNPNGLSDFGTKFWKLLHP